MRRSFKLCYLLYKSTLMTRNSFLVKAVLGRRQQTFQSLVSLEIFKFVVSLLIFYFFMERLSHINVTASFLMLLTVYLMGSLGPAFEKVDRIKQRILFDYTKLSTATDTIFYRRILRLDWVVKELIGMPPKLAVLIVMVAEEGIRCLPWVMAIEVLALFIFLVGRATRTDHGLFETLLTLTGKALVGSIGYVIFGFITFVIGTSRRDAEVYGLNLVCFTKFNEQFNNYLHNMNPLKSSIIHWMMSIKVLLMLVVAVAVGAIIIIVSLGMLNEPQTSDHGWIFWPQLIRKIKPPRPPDGCTVKDSYLLRRLAQTISGSPLNVLIPGELILAMSANGTVMPYVHTLYPELLLFFIEGYVIQSGVTRTIAHYFSPVLRFENDVRHIDLYTLVSLPVGETFGGKCHWLKALTMRLSPVCLSILIVDFAFYVRENFLFLLPLSVALWIGLIWMIPMIMKVDFHVFAMLYATRQQLQIQSIREFAGYRLVLASDTAIHRGFMLSSTLLLMIATSLGFVHGIQWAGVDALFFVGLALVVFVSSQGLPGTAMSMSD